MEDQKIQMLQLRRELIQTQQMVLSYQLRDVVAELDKLQREAAPAAPTDAL